MAQSEAPKLDNRAVFPPLALGRIDLRRVLVRFQLLQPREVTLEELLEEGVHPQPVFGRVGHADGVPCCLVGIACLPHHGGGVELITRHVAFALT